MPTKTESQARRRRGQGGEDTPTPERRKESRSDEETWNGSDDTIEGCAEGLRLLR